MTAATVRDALAGDLNIPDDLEKTVDAAIWNFPADSDEGAKIVEMFEYAIALLSVMDEHRALIAIAVARQAAAWIEG